MYIYVSEILSELYVCIFMYQRYLVSYMYVYLFKIYICILQFVDLNRLIMILSSLVYQSYYSFIILIIVTLLSSCNSETASECDVTVNINTTKPSNDCSIADDTGDILTYECSSLQIAFEHIQNEITSLNCTEILLLSGEHVITRNFTFTESIVIAPSDSAALGSIYVSFEIDTNIMESLAKFEPLYVWKFESVEYVSISGIHFASSPGIIIMNDVFDVQVTNCTFE